MTPTVWEDASQWQIHFRREAWPQRAGFHFIVAAFDDVLNTLWKLQTEEVVGEFEEAGGYRSAAADFFHSALMTGAFVAQAQPNRGGATRSVLPTDWVPETVDRALATGRMERKLNGRRDDMWIYIDDAELELMLKVLSLTDMLYPPDECGPLEVMGETILGNMSAIAQARRPRDTKAAADEVLKLMLPSMQPSFDDADRRSLVTAVATLLREKFDADPDGLLDRDAFETPIIAAYSSTVSSRTFDRAWREATLWKDSKGKQPYKSRRNPGRKRSV